MQLRPSSAHVLALAMLGAGCTLSSSPDTRADGATMIDASADTTMDAPVPVDDGGSAFDLCAQFDEIAGMRATIPVHLDAHVQVHGEGLVDGFCVTAACPVCARWWLAMECPDRYVAFVPGWVLGVTETDPASTSNMFCVEPSDGTPQGGASCYPTGCSRLTAQYEPSNVQTVTGLLQSTPRDAVAIDGRPIYLFAIESMTLGPYDPLAHCDPAVPQQGCPCEGRQISCPRGLTCNYFGPPNVWTPLPDACGLG